MVNDIRQHRLANSRFGLSTDTGAIGDELDYQNAVRMQGIPNAGSYIMTDSAPPPPQMLPAQGLWLSNAAVASSFATGAKTLSEWWLDGAQPVDFGTSNQRASICIRCPKNSKAPLSAYFTNAAADLIHKAIEYRNSIKLRTDFDDRLGTCEACDCPMKLKVHVPLETILKHMPSEDVSKLDPICWITK